MLISVDLWGTLIKSHPEHKMQRAHVVKDYLHEIGYNSYNVLDIIKTIRECELRFDKLQEHFNLQLSVKSSWALILEMLFVSPEELLKVNLDELMKRLEENFLKYPPILLPGATELINFTLEKDIPLILMSNTSLTSGSVIEDWMRTVNMERFYSMAGAFTEIFFSDYHQKCKPDPEFFNLIYSTELTIDSNLYHVGDNIITDGGCTKCGFNFLHVKNEDGYRLPDIVNQLKELWKQQ